MAGKLHHVVQVVRPERYFVHRLLQLANPHLTVEKLEWGWGNMGQISNERGGREKIRIKAEIYGWWSYCLKTRIYARQGNG